MNAYTYRLTSDNNQVWGDESVTGPFAQKSYVLYATDTVIYLAGRTCTGANLDSCDALVFAVDAVLGDTLWTFEWDGDVAYEEIDGLVPKSDGIYITGWTKSSSEAMDITLMKLDYSGALLWQNQWGSGLPRDDRQDGHIVVDDSMIYLCGVYDSSPGFALEGSALLAKFDKTNGNFVDTTLFGRNDAWQNAEDALGMSSDGTYLYLTGSTTTSADNWDLFTAKFDKDLNMIWHTVWGGPVNADVARAVQPAHDGSIYIAGTTKSYGNGLEEAVLLKLDSNGTPLWYKTWGGTGDDHVLDLHLVDSTSIYIAGMTNSFHPSNKQEAFLLKIGMDSLTNSITEEAFETVNIYPNPSTGLFHCQLNSQEATINVYSALGELIPINFQKIDGEITFDLSSQSSGVYFLQVQTEISTRTIRLVKE